MNVNRNYILAIGFFFVFVVFGAQAQQKSKSVLEKEKKESLRKIKEAEKILNETENKKKASVGQLNALNQQIKIREDLISSIRDEIDLLDEEVVETNDIVMSLEDDLKSLKKEYAAMIYAAYKAKRRQEQLNFIFSSRSFNQLLRRVKYMRQYGEERKKQAEQINKVRAILAVQVAEIKNKKIEKGSLLEEQIAESENLDELKQKQNKVVRKLETQESSIKNELKENKRAVARLDRLIGNLIKKEIAKASSKSKSKSKAKIALTPEGARLSNSFEGNKTKLSWPVTSGFITQKFGKQKHPTLKGIYINNNGVNIQTNQDENVKAVFDGEVVRVAFVSGMGNIVLIKHGDYFTLYSKLKKVAVKNGQQVMSSDKIGTVLTDKNGISELHFEIWKNLKLQNPELWLSRN